MSSDMQTLLLHRCGRVHWRRREQLSGPCKVMLFDHEVRMGESIDFQAPMKWACTAGEAFCLADAPTARPVTACVVLLIACSVIIVGMLA